MNLLGKMHRYRAMLSYFFNYKNNTENISQRILKTSNNKTMTLLNCATYGNKKSRFIKEIEQVDY